MLNRFAVITAAVLLAWQVIEIEHADAQLRSHQPLQRMGRALGMGQGVGYHWRSPGPNTDYYNPYTPTNSYLVSQHGRPAAGPYGYTGYGAAPGTSQGIPYSVYAPTDGVAKPNGYDSGLQGQSLNPSFEPMEDEDDKELSQDDNDNDFDTGTEELPTPMPADDDDATDKFDSDFEDRGFGDSDFGDDAGFEDRDSDFDSMFKSDFNDQRNDFEDERDEANVAETASLGRSGTSSDSASGGSASDFSSFMIQ